MTPIPLIVGFGGINTAGRSSFHHGYRRTLIDVLGSDKADRTYKSLASLMGIEIQGQLTDQQRQQILDGTLIRKIESAHFDSANIPTNKRLPLDIAENQPATFTTKKRNLPELLPPNWQVDELSGSQVQVTIHGQQEFLVPTTSQGEVQSAGQLPSGFKPGKLYQSRSHPRGLEMTIFGASDALASMGIDWSEVQRRVAPDMISVYAGSAMGQLDANGSGGMIGTRFNGKRVTSKHLPFGLAEMAADFINAYVHGSVGTTGTNVGACASFLYNLRQGVIDIQTGKARVVVVGNSEAPIVPDVLDGYIAMGALATDNELLELDKTLGLTSPDHRRACRPFSTNCGFTVAESSQYIVLFDDALALEMGASIHGAIGDVFINADGHKKSISSPGVGNYITVGKALGAARSILGDESIRHRSFVHAHGTSTPQNRVTESHILNEMAKNFGIEKWPVAAIKAYLGHSLAVSSGDQIVSSLGVWNEGFIPGIATIDHIADDVFHSHLDISASHKEVGTDGIDVAIVNAKGFGGNNASGLVLAPHVVSKMLERRHGASAMSDYHARNEPVRQAAADYDQSAIDGDWLPVYKFDHNVIGGDDITLASGSMLMPGYDKEIDLDVDSPYKDLL